MRKCMLFILLFCCSANFIAQTIENPAFENSDVPTFHIKKVEITKDTTYIFCLYYAEARSWANISKDTYLRDSESHKIFPLQRCEGLPYSPETRSFYQKGSYELLFCFPSINGTEQFDFIEVEGERGFNIYGVSLRHKYKTSYTDAELKRISEMVSTYVFSNGTDMSMQLKDYATSLNNLESYNASIGNFEEVVRLGIVEADIREKIFGKEDSSYIGLLSSLGGYNAALGNYNEAVKLGEEEVQIRKEVFGTEDSYYVNLLETLASYYKELGNYTEAAKLQMEATNIIKKSSGVENIEYAYSLTNAAIYYADCGNYDEAIKTGTEAIEILNRVIGTENPDYAAFLTSLAYCYSEIGNYREAIRLETEATGILKKVVGSDHPKYAESLSNLGDYYTFLGNYNNALQIGTEAIELLKKIVGTDHPSYARSLSNLARLNSILGNYTKAISLGTEAMEIDKKIYGTEHPSYATSLNNLAGYYQDIGNYDETLRLMTEAIEIYKRVLGTEHRNYVISINNLANYYSKVGNYSEAIRFGIEAMELYKKSLGTEHHLYATSLNNLASYYSDVCNYSEAIRLRTEAMEIYKRVLGTEHPHYAASLNGLASINAEIGNYSEAIKLGTETMEINKRVLGTEHPEYARSLNGLAIYYSKVGNYSEAIRLGTEALEIRKRILGIKHPFYATSLHNLAEYYSDLGNYSEAIRLETEAMELFNKIVGTRHPYYSMSLNQLALYHVKYGNFPEAYNCLQQSLTISQSFVLKNFTEISSRNQENMWNYNYAYKYNTFLPYITTKYQTKQTISELYDKTCLFAKGILLNAGIEIRKLILESGDSVMIDKYNALSSNISLYNKLLEKPIKERFMNADSLNRVIEQQEMMLARESKTYGDYTHNLTINWKDVQKKLDRNDIAIEFLNFTNYNRDSTMYVALTLKKNYDSPHIVILFEEKQLKAIPENVYYTQTDVSDLVWKPLEEELRDVRTIYFAPSGTLHRIGIEYLPLSKTESISDVYTLHRLSSTRQLAVIQDESKGKKNILYGGIKYDDKSNAISTDSVSTKGAVLRSAYRSNVDSLSLRNSFDYLEGTKREADLIAEDMKRHGEPYIYHSGTDGSEESFKKLDGTWPKAMHIATHGFYFTEAEAEKSQIARPEIELLMVEDPNFRRSIEYKPMTRSGLLFSGCNRIIRHEQIPDGEEDGILTAQEISTLDLRGLDLVVLSACQTGLGDIISGEGVFGLQRGFKKAGAKTIIMSLWNVNDESTMKMMTSFYHHFLEGMSKEEAFHKAQDELRKDCSSQQERPDWAAFILLDGMN